MAFSSDLERLLARWLPRQRWYPELGGRAGQEPDLTPVSVVRLADAEDRDTGVVRVLAAVLSVAAGRRSARIALPLTFRTREAVTLREHRIGEVDDLLLGRVGVYDGAADPVCVQALLDLASVPASLPEQHVSGHLAGEELGAPERPTPFAPEPEELLRRSDELTVRVAASRGQETRTVVDSPDGTFVMTFLRTLSERQPPAVRVPLALTAVGSQTVHPVVGWVQTRWFDVTAQETLSAPFAFVSHALPGSYPAWQDAVSLAMRTDSGSVGSFNRQASVLGTAVGELHGDLAGEFGLVQSGGEPTARLVGKWQNRIGWALRTASGALTGLHEQLREHARSLEAFTSVGPLQRIHGELTLDHILTGTAEGPRIISFSTDADDEPRPVALDLVALLRSVDYAAGYSWLRRTGGFAEKSPLLRQVATEGLFSTDSRGAELREEYASAPERLWCGQAINSLLSGYSHAVGGTASLSDPVLRAALVDRLLVEIVTERRNRPAWVIVPLAALSALLGPPETVDVIAADAPMPAEAASATAWPEAPDVLPSATEAAAEVGDAVGSGAGVDAAEAGAAEQGAAESGAAELGVAAPGVAAPGVAEDEETDAEAAEPVAAGEAVAAGEGDAPVRGAASAAEEAPADEEAAPADEEAAASAGGDPDGDAEAAASAGGDAEAAASRAPGTVSARTAETAIAAKSAGTGSRAESGATNAFGLPVASGPEAAPHDAKRSAKHSAKRTETVPEAARKRSEKEPAQKQQESAGQDGLALPVLVDMPAVGTPPALAAAPVPAPLDPDASARNVAAAVTAAKEASAAEAGDGEAGGAPEVVENRSEPEPEPEARAAAEAEGENSPEAEPEAVAETRGHPEASDHAETGDHPEAGQADQAGQIHESHEDVPAGQAYEPPASRGDDPAGGGHESDEPDESHAGDPTDDFPEDDLPDEDLAEDDEDEDLAEDDMGSPGGAPRPKPVRARRWSEDDFTF